MEIITEITPQEYNKWQQFVYEHPLGNVFQTPYMYKVYRETQNYNPVLILQNDDNNEISGVLLAVQQTFAPGVAASLSSRSLILGGPLVINNDKQLLNRMLSEYESIIKNKAVFTEVRNSFKTEVYDQSFMDSGYEYDDHLNILVDLKKSREELWRDVHSKRRNEIRRAGREGTSFAVSEEKDIIQECYVILEEVYNRAKLPLPDISVFMALHKHSNDENGLRVFIALNNGRIIGTMFALYFRDVLYDYYAGSLRQYYDKYPNDLIPWEVFLWGKSNGYNLFDFGGAGKPGVPYGVRDYKKKFGGKLVNFGRYRKIHQPLKMKLAETGFKAWKLIKSL